MSRPIGAHSAVGALFWSTPLDDPQRNALGSSNAGNQQGRERQELENPAAQGSDPDHDEAGGRQQALGPHGDSLAARQGHRDSQRDRGGQILREGWREPSGGQSEAPQGTGQGKRQGSGAQEVRLVGCSRCLSRKHGGTTGRDPRRPQVRGRRFTHFEEQGQKMGTP